MSLHVWAGILEREIYREGHALHGVSRARVESALLYLLDQGGVVGESGAMLGAFTYSESVGISLTFYICVCCFFWSSLDLFYFFFYCVVGLFLIEFWHFFIREIRLLCCVSKWLFSSLSFVL